MGYKKIIIRIMIVAIVAVTTGHVVKVAGIGLGIGVAVGVTAGIYEAIIYLRK